MGMGPNARLSRTPGGPGATLSQQSQRHRGTITPALARRPSGRGQFLNSKRRGCLFLLPFVIIIVLAIRSIFPKHHPQTLTTIKPDVENLAHNHESGHYESTHQTSKTYSTKSSNRKKSRYRSKLNRTRRRSQVPGTNTHDHHFDRRDIVILDHSDTEHGHGHPVSHEHGHHESPVKVIHSGSSVQTKSDENEPTKVNPESQLSRISQDTSNQVKIQDQSSVTLPPISAVVLFHAEYPTLLHTLDTWEKNGLVGVVSEFVFFLNGISSRDEFDKQVPRIRDDPQWRDKTRVVTSTENRALGLAIREMVRLASNEHVLLLEKDWALIEPVEQVRSQLSASASLLKQGKVNIVRFRHRHKPGAPLHARIMHQGREAQMLQQQSNLYCFMHHWIRDLDGKYPTFFQKCDGDYTSLSEPMWCSVSRYCQWTNNPGLFYKSWFLQNLGDPFERDHQETSKKDPGSGMLDFEFYMNWKQEAWNTRGFVIGLPLGLFEHQEVGENNIQNTLWYGWNRLNTDAEEKMREYLETERKECAIVSKTHRSGILYPDKFPLDFVHLYHYDKAMTKTTEQAVVELGKKGAELVELLESDNGNWRAGVTDLTNLYYEKVLYSYPIEPVAMKITFVTSIYQGIGLVKAIENLNQIGRSYPTIVYTDDYSGQKIRIALKNSYGWTEEHVQKVKFVTESMDGMLSRVLGQFVISTADKIMSGDDWKRVATSRNGGSLPKAEDVKLSLAKPVLLRDAERMTVKQKEELPYDFRYTTHFVWMDATSQCVSKSGNAFNHKSSSGNRALNTLNDHVFRGHMVLNTMVSGKRVTSDAEITSMLGRTSGFDIRRLLEESEVRNLPAEGLKVIDGRTMGGSRLAITLMSSYYDVVLRDMLRKGQLGTEREPLTIAHKNVEYNFRFMDAWNACPNGVDCGNVEEVTRAEDSDVQSQSGCRLFEWASHCAVNVGRRRR